MRQTGFSRIPVYHEDPDNVAGIAHIKDLIQPALDGKGDQPIAGFLRDATFVPDTKDILPLLSEMQTSHDQIVVVVDEYGGTAGIITIEDIVEEIVGEIEDEFDPDNKYLTRLSRRRGSSMGVFRAMTRLSLVGRSRKAMILSPSPAGFWSFATRCPTSERCLRSRGTSSRCSRCVASASGLFA